jgi:preprotein translocase subunit SecF
MAAGRLEVEIMARLDKLEAGLKKAEQSAKSTGSAIDKSMSTPTGKTALAMGKVLGSMAALELGVKGLNAGLQFASGVTAAFAGESQKAEDAFIAMGEVVKTLPAGIGPLAQAVEDLVLAFHDLDEITKENERTAALGAQRREMAEQIKLKRENNILLNRELDVMQIQDPIMREREQFLLDEAKIRLNLEKELQELRSLEEAGSQGVQFQLKQEAEIRIQMLEVAKEKNIRLIEERQEQERIRLIETKRLEDVRRAEEEQIRLQRERQARERTMQEKAMEAARKLAEQEKLLEAQRQSALQAAQATTTAQTALGTFRFGQLRSGSGQGKANAHLQGIEEGIGIILTLLRTSLRHVGVN